jgi:hypothetical protein
MQELTDTNHEERYTAIKPSSNRVTSIIPPDQTRNLSHKTANDKRRRSETSCQNQPKKAKTIGSWLQELFYSKLDQLREARKRSTKNTYPLTATANCSNGKQTSEQDTSPTAKKIYIYEDMPYPLSTKEVDSYLSLN